MSLLSAFNQQRHKTPDKIALIEGDQQLSYRQVFQQATLISNYLQTLNSCERVVIALDRGIDATIAIFATLQASACYIPLDLKNPASRLNFIIADADVQSIIGKGPCPDWLGSAELWLDIEQLESTEPQAEITIRADSIAAILYTSGSTGNPKGVALSHKAMLNFADWAGNTFNISNTDRIASLAPFHFDLSVFDLFCSLSRGATVHFIPSVLAMSPSRLTTWLSEQKITVWYTVPSLLSFIALKGALTTTPLQHLKTILFAGEVFPSPQLIKLCTLLPNVSFYNLYGPTETNVCCYWPVDRSRLSTEQAIPIGMPACDSILNINNDELVVTSENNLAGYWQQGQLRSACSQENAFHTGDKVSLNKLGEYCYHGRLDRMLKCSGYRVEPAEIEHAILLRPEVEQCAVIGIKDSTSGQRPAAAVVLKADSLLSDIIKPIRQTLPAYMQPCKFIILDTLPYLANGKTDYQQLLTQMENT